MTKSLAIIKELGESWLRMEIPTLDDLARLDKPIHMPPISSRRVRLVPINEEEGGTADAN